MHVYTFRHTDNVDCNIKPGSEVCVGIDKKNRFKLRSCYATWRTSPIEEVKVCNHSVHVNTANSCYSILCDTTREARRLADAILDRLN